MSEITPMYVLKLMFALIMMYIMGRGDKADNTFIRLFIMAAVYGVLVLLRFTVWK